MKLRICFLSLSLPLLLLGAAAAFGQGDPNRTVVTVNGEEVKAGEYYRRMEFLPGVGRRMGASFAEFPPGLLTLEQLITERLVLQLAKKKGVLPSDAEVRDEIEFQKKQNPKYISDWLATGQTETDLAFSTRIKLAQFKLISFGVNVTDQEVEDHYRRNFPVYAIPKQVSLRVIAVDTEDKAKQVDAQLAAGKSFADVAKALSLDVTAALGGEYGKRSYNDLAKIVQEEIDKIKIGGITQWLVGESTRVKFQLIAAEAEKVRPLDDTLKRQIRRELMTTRGNNKNKIRDEMLEMRKTAQIDITQKEFADAYKKFIDAFLSSGG